MSYLRYLSFLRIMVSNTYCVLFCFVFLRLLYTYVANSSFDCPFFIAPSVFSNVYLNLYVGYSFFVTQKLSYV